MSTGMTIFDTQKLKVPAHVANFFGEESNIAERQTVPALSYEGKVWTISVNGEKTRLMKADENGDEVAIPVMRVVVVDYAKRRGRTYYQGAYDPAKPGTPLCWSDDGQTPHANVQQPQSSRCDTCPMAAKGSKITEQGKSIAACSQHRMVAVVPADNLQFTPLRMKLAITSDWDKNEELAQQGWFAFQNYTDMLRTKGVQHTAALVTKMRFDPSVAFPKVLFAPDRWLNDEELAAVRPTVKSDEVKALLSGTWSPNGVDGTKLSAAPAAAPKAAPAPASVPSLLDDEDAAPAPKAAAKAAPKAAKPALTIVDNDDDAEDLAPPAKTEKVAHKKETQQVAAAPKAAATSVNSDLSALLDSWDE